MYFPFSVQKAIQAIGVLFREDKVTRMNYMRLLKLLYIADREALQETGRTIVGGPVSAMKRGPVLQEVYDLIRGQHRNLPAWDAFLRRDRFDLELVQDPDVVKLSRYEIEKLSAVAHRHGDDDEWSLSNITHGFAEWRKNDPGESCRPLPLTDTLDAIGLHDAIADILADANEAKEMDRLLGR